MKTNDIKTGFALAGKLGGDFNKLADLMEIRRLNARASNEWVRYNNAGNPAGQAASEAKQDKAWDKAQAIAARNGWKIDAPGLYWTVTNKSGYEISRGL
jgi:hypothetical protein